jgi:hypothetical protein
LANIQPVSRKPCPPFWYMLENVNPANLVVSDGIHAKELF